MAVGLDWASVERVLVEALVQAVRSTVAEHPDQRFYAAVLDRIYRETDGPLTLPSLAMNSVEALAQLPVEEQAEVRWSAADWDHYDDEWLAEDLARDWERRLTEQVLRGTTRQWEATFRRYLAMLVRVCKQARAALRTTGVTDRDFVVLLLDDEYHETLIKRVLTKGEVSRHFPEYDHRAVKLARVAALPQAERAAYYVARLEAFDGPISGEDAEAALRDLGSAAFPALKSMLSAKDRAWQAAKLLADIGQPDDDVVSALHAALTRSEGTDQSWVACALARLGRLDLVLGQIHRLPREVVVSAVVAPYTSFRNQAVAAPRLDYRPLQDVIERRPVYVPALAEELKPGSAGTATSPSTRWTKRSAGWPARTSSSAGTQCACSANGVSVPPSPDGSFRYCARPSAMTPTPPCGGWQSCPCCCGAETPTGTRTWSTRRSTTQPQRSAKPPPTGCGNKNDRPCGVPKPCRSV